MRDHLEGSLEHFRTGLSNSVIEAVIGLIQAAKARARGYATDHRLIVMCYLIGGKLKHPPTDLWIASAVQTAK